MSTDPENITVNVNQGENVTALLYSAPKKERTGTTLVLGHGAGGNQLSGFMRLFAAGLAGRGIDAVTFNFLYSERGRSVPDQAAKLEACYRAVIEAASKHKKLKSNRLAIGGKSMGGRIASQVAAAASRGEESDNLATEVAALVFLGYPLHPPGKPEQLRDKHLKDIRSPMLCVQGSRDAFGTADELRAIMKNQRLPMTLYIIEGGDHSLKVPKSSGVTQQQVYEATMDEIAAFLDQ